MACGKVGRKGGTKQKFILKNKIIIYRGGKTDLGSYFRGVISQGERIKKKQGRLRI